MLVCTRQAGPFISETAELVKIFCAAQFSNKAGTTGIFPHTATYWIYGEISSDGQLCGVDVRSQRGQTDSRWWEGKRSSNNHMSQEGLKDANSNKMCPTVKQMGCSSWSSDQLPLLLDRINNYNRLEKYCLIWCVSVSTLTFIFWHDRFYLSCLGPTTDGLVCAGYIFDTLWSVGKLFLFLLFSCYFLKIIIIKNFKLLLLLATYFQAFLKYILLFQMSPNPNCFSWQKQARIYMETC